jgi:hypothetical protein
MDTTSLHLNGPTEASGVPGYELDVRAILRNYFPEAA